MTIDIRQVSKSFGHTRVLDGLSLEIPAQQRVALVGANGAGKTTLIRCLLGQYVYDGEISIEGRSPRVARREVLARVGFVPQLPPPLGLTVGQLVRFAAGLCGASPERMVSVAVRLGLDVESLRNRVFSKLSGGQKQKLLIAVALGRDTNLLIMDEPAANLDPDARRIFFDLLAERSQQATMLISSHRLDEVAQLVHRVVELDRGQICLDDHVADSGDLDALLHCHIEFSRREASAEKTLAEWGFAVHSDGLRFEGSVPAPDRLRFLGMLARYSGMIRRLELDSADVHHAADSAGRPNRKEVRR